MKIQEHLITKTAKLSMCVKQLHGINRYGADGRFPREHKFSVETSYQVVTDDKIENGPLLAKK